MQSNVYSLSLHEADLTREVAIYDIADLLPRIPHRRSRDQRPTGAFIDRTILHHSGALGRGGYEGAFRAVKYAMKRGFPGAPYHYWIPFEPVFDASGRYVIYRLAEDEYRAWHTGAKANDFGVGVCVQGNTSRNGLSDAQRVCLEALFPYLMRRHDLEARDFGSHREGKKFGAKRNKWACPGKEAFKWLKEWRRECG